jgi:hypothetical protein
VVPCQAGFERVSVAAAEAETASSWAGWGPAGWMRCLRSKYNLDGGWNEMEEAVWVLEYTRADAPGEGSRARGNVLHVLAV